MYTTACRSPSRTNLISGWINVKAGKAARMPAMMKTPPLVHYPVSPQVNSARSEGLDLIEAAAWRGLFIQAGIVWGEDGQGCRKVSKFVSNGRDRMKINQYKSKV